MFKLNFQEQNKSIGKAPGNIEQLIDENQSSDLVMYRYNESCADFEKAPNINELEVVNYDDQVVWLNFTGKPSKTQIDFLKEKFNIESLTLEDILIKNHRPKLEEVGNYLFCVLRIPYIKDEDIMTQQFSVILKNNVLISFLDLEETVFDDLKKRILNAQAKVRSRKEDFLFYLLLDAVVDKYFYALNYLNLKYESSMESIETEHDFDSFKNIQNLKHEILNLRRNISAIKDIIYRLNKDESGIITKESIIYIRDLVDHSHHANESAEMLREMIISLIDLSHNMLSNRMNEIMKVLTIISTIFIPISFIAGLYGMNFASMPELNFQYGYQVVVGVMITIALGMLAYFKSQKWF